MKVTVDVTPDLARKLRGSEQHIRKMGEMGDGSTLFASVLASARAAVLILDALPTAPKVGDRVRSLSSPGYEGEVLFVHEDTATALVLWDGVEVPQTALFARLEVIG